MAVESLAYKWHQGESAQWLHSSPRTSIPLGHRFKSQPLHIPPSTLPLPRGASGSPPRWKPSPSSGYVTILGVSQHLEYLSLTLFQINESLKKKSYCMHPLCAEH